jgi:hypothetical protein
MKISSSNLDGYDKLSAREKVREYNIENRKGKS